MELICRISPNVNTLIQLLVYPTILLKLFCSIILKSQKLFNLDLINVIIEIDWLDRLKIIIFFTTSIKFSSQVLTIIIIDSLYTHRYLIFLGVQN